MTSWATNCFSGIRIFCDDDFLDDQSFLIADVGGNFSGQFNGFGEGDLIGNFSGHNLFISYGGSGLTLFTAVPEPGTLTITGLAIVICSIRRRKRVG